jgi:hypothetical protein
MKELDLLTKLSKYEGDSKFKYKIGETVKPSKEFDTTSGECGSGIHGYIDFVDAVKY